jgi:hypothetical protein
MNSSAANRSALLHASSISLIGERLLHFRLNRNSRRRDGSIDRSGSSAMFACRSCAVQRREVGGKTRERRQRRRLRLHEREPDRLGLAPQRFRHA